MSRFIYEVSGVPQCRAFVFIPIKMKSGKSHTTNDHSCLSAEHCCLISEFLACLLFSNDIIKKKKKIEWNQMKNEGFSALDAGLWLGFIRLQDLWLRLRLKRFQVHCGWGAGGSSAPNVTHHLHRFHGVRFVHHAGTGSGLLVPVETMLSRTYVDFIYKCVRASLENCIWLWCSSVRIPYILYTKLPATRNYLQYYRYPNTWTNLYIYFYNILYFTFIILFSFD